MGGGPWRAEGGQALVLAALVTGLVSTALMVGVWGVALEVGARASLTKAVSAAALAALQGERVRLRLQVSFVDQRCRQVRRGTTCRATAGAATETLAGAGAFAALPEGGFGPLPAWAAAAGCVGTLWPAVPPPSGTYRVCLGQRLMGARLVPPAQGVLWAAARSYLAADAPAGGVLGGARVTAVRVGPVGQVTVQAAGSVRPALLWFRAVTASATAWPRPGL